MTYTLDEMMEKLLDYDGDMLSLARELGVKLTELLDHCFELGVPKKMAQLIELEDLRTQARISGQRVEVVKKLRALSRESEKPAEIIRMGVAILKSNAWRPNKKSNAANEPCEWEELTPQRRRYLEGLLDPVDAAGP